MLHCNADPIPFYLVAGLEKMIIVYDLAGFPVGPLVEVLMPDLLFEHQHAQVSFRNRVLILFDCEWTCSV